MPTTNDGKPIKGCKDANVRLQFILKEKIRLSAGFVQLSTSVGWRVMAGYGPAKIIAFRDLKGSKEDTNNF